MIEVWRPGRPQGERRPRDAEQRGRRRHDRPAAKPPRASPPAKRRRSPRTAKLSPPTPQRPPMASASHVTAVRVTAVAIWRAQGRRRQRCRSAEAVEARSPEGKPEQRATGRSARPSRPAGPARRGDRPERGDRPPRQDRGRSAARPRPRSWPRQRQRAGPHLGVEPGAAQRQQGARSEFAVRQAPGLKEQLRGQQGPVASVMHWTDRFGVVPRMLGSAAHRQMAVACARGAHALGRRRAGQRRSGPRQRRAHRHVEPAGAAGDVVTIALDRNVRIFKVHGICRAAGLRR